MEKLQANILVLFAHPSLQHSRINRTLKNIISNIDQVTLHDLYDAYPEFYINVKYEQELLKTHDLIIFQHPLYWYSTTPMLKLWQDVVLTEGFAYGNKGDHLHGKHFLQVISTGGKEQAYTNNGYNGFTMQQLLAPMRATIKMCGMHYHPPLILHHSYKTSDHQLAQHAQTYQQLLIDFSHNGASVFEREHS